MIEPSAFTNSCGFFAGFALGKGLEGRAICCHATSCPKWAHGVLDERTSEKFTNLSPTFVSGLRALAGIAKSALVRGFTVGSFTSPLEDTLTEVCHGLYGIPIVLKKSATGERSEPNTGFEMVWTGRRRADVGSAGL